MICACAPDDYYGGYYGDDYADSTTEDGDSNYDGIRVYEGYSYWHTPSFVPAYHTITCK